MSTDLYSLPSHRYPENPVGRFSWPNALALEQKRESISEWEGLWSDVVRSKKDGLSRL